MSRRKSIKKKSQKITPPKGKIYVKLIAPKGIYQPGETMCVDRDQGISMIDAKIAVLDSNHPNDVEIAAKVIAAEER